jgi:hypothetical protein
MSSVFDKKVLVKNKGGMPRREYAKNTHSEHFLNDGFLGTFLGRI